MQLEIRLCAEADWEAVAAIARDAFKLSVTAESLREAEANQDPRCFRRCWLAEANGRPVAYSLCSQFIGMFHPQKFDWEPAVLSAYRGRGIGSQLWGHLQREMQAYNPIAFTCNALENCPESVAFLEHRGFVETMRHAESHLYLPGFDPAAFMDPVQAAAERGYTFRTYADLGGGPDLDRRLHALVMELRRDVPSPEPRTEIPTDVWINTRLHRSEFLPALFLIAFKGDDMVGVTNMWAGDRPDVLDTGLTAVKRDHRGQGLARALKVQSLAAAKAAGYRLVKTWNEVNNRPMLAINNWLGFQRQPGRISYVLNVGRE